MNTGNGAKKPKRPLVRNKISFFMYLSFWTTIVVMFLGLLISQASRYNEVRANYERIQASIARERAINEDLYLQMTFFDSDAHIEQLARERLGMIHPNQIVFRNQAD